MPLLNRLHGTQETWAVDLPGHGSSRKTKIPEDIPGLRDAVLEFLEAAELAPAHLLGWSLGAQLAVAAAAHSPQHARGLVLAGPTVDRHARTFSR